MTRHIFAACGALAIAGMTAGVTAQTTSPSQQPRGTDSANSVTVSGCLKSWDGKTSMEAGTTGKPGASTTTGTTTGTTGATGTASATTGAAGTKPGAQADTRQAGVAQFVLTDATMSGGMSTSAPGTTTGTTPAPAARTMGHDDHSQFLLRANGASVNLKSHVNQQIEVTGRMTMNDSSHMSKPGAKMGATGTAGATGTTGQPRATAQAGATAHGESMPLPTLMVTSVKMISATCSAR